MKADGNKRKPNSTGELSELRKCTTLDYHNFLSQPNTVIKGSFKTYVTEGAGEYALFFVTDCYEKYRWWRV